MPDFGLTDQGFIPQTRAEIRAELEEDFRGEFGRSLPLGNKTALGFWIGIVSDRVGALWEIEESNYSMMDPDKARKAALAALCLLTGTFKKEATATVAIETLCGDDATVVAAGAVISLLSSGVRFATLETATLVALDAWVAATPYIKGDRVTNSALCFECITTGVSAGAGGPAVDAADVLDNTVHWTCMGEGTAATDTVVGCLTNGDVFAAARDITVIETPIGGLNTARNLEDARSGREEDTDEQLRLRRETDLATPGTGPVDAIRAALLQVPGVTAASVFFNNNDATDGDGIPGHSVEALVTGGSDQAIWQCLWDNVAAGIKTHGAEVGTVIDSQGREQTLRFTRPDELQIFTKITLVKDPKRYPADGDAQVRAAIAAWGQDQETGRDVDSSALSAQAFTVTGVLKVTEVLVGTVDPPVSDATIAVSLRQFATYATADIDVITSDRIP